MVLKDEKTLSSLISANIGDMKHRSLTGAVVDE